MADRGAFGQLAGNVLNGRSVKLRYRRAGSNDAWTVLWMQPQSSAGAYELTIAPTSDMEFQASYPVTRSEGLRFSESDTAEGEGEQCGLAEPSARLSCSCRRCWRGALPPPRPTVGPASARRAPHRSPSALGPPAPSPEVWLRGPFGRVAGGTLGAPAAAAPQGTPLDAFVRRAPLVLETGTDQTLGALTVVARPVTGSGAEETLSTFWTDFEGPDAPGTHVIVAIVASDTGATTEHAWLVDVPDRQPPPDGLYDIPAPDVLVQSAAGSAAGILGDGCYVYLCVEAGPPPPLSTLEPLTVAAGEVPLVRLSDGSVITAWEGRLSPVGRTPGRPRQASGVLADTTEPAVALAGLEPPTAGAWRLDLEVELDRERGWLRTTHRLIAD